MTPQEEQELAKGVDDILEVFANTIALGIMGNVPGAEGTPIYTNPAIANQKLVALFKAQAAQHALEQRLVELDLLEQALNEGRDIQQFKLQRLADLTKRLEQLHNPKKGNLT